MAGSLWSPNTPRYRRTTKQVYCFAHQVQELWHPYFRKKRRIHWSMATYQVSEAPLAAGIPWGWLAGRPHHSAACTCLLRRLEKWLVTGWKWRCCHPVSSKSITNFWHSSWNKVLLLFTISVRISYSLHIVLAIKMIFTLSTSAFLQESPVRGVHSMLV